MKPLELFGELIGLQTFAKLHHLAVSKVNGAYATHMALGDFYAELEDFTDGLIESYQGKYGVQGIEVKSQSISMPILNKLKAFANMLESCTAFGDRNTNTYLYNQIDEITSLTYSTIYKLENLKDSK